MFSLPPWASAELRCDDPMPPACRQCVACGGITVNKFVKFCFSHFKPVSLAAVIAEKRELLASLQEGPEALQRKSCIATVLGELEELRMVHDDDAEASEPDPGEAGRSGGPDGPDAEQEEGPHGEAGRSSGPDGPDAGNIAFSREYAMQLWQEASTGVTRKGVRLDDEQRLARVTKLKQSAVTLAPRYRTARLARIGPLEQRFAAHLAATANDIKAHVDAALDPLLMRSEGRIPPRREDQTAAERKQEIDQALVATRLLREERKRLVEEERAAKARPKRRRAEPEHDGL